MRRQLNLYLINYLIIQLPTKMNEVFIASLISLNKRLDFAFEWNCLKLQESIRYSETQFHSTTPL